MLTKYATLPTAWVDEEEPTSTLSGRAPQVLLNARMDLTADELRGIQHELERLLEPFTTRASEEMPAGVAAVRILAYFLPEAKRDTPTRASGVRRSAS